jgi:hypothetical protein
MKSGSVFNVTEAFMWCLYAKESIDYSQASFIGHVHLAYNLSYSAYFFSRNNIFLSQKISQQCFSAGL